MALLDGLVLAAKIADKYYEYKKVLFKPGVGSKYFKTIWNDDTKRKNLLEARHRKKT
jgi:hypothetical protein